MLTEERLSSPAPVGSLPQSKMITNWTKVASNVLSLVFGVGTAQALMAISVLFTARQLGSVKFGEYAASFSAAGLTSILFNLGLDTWLLQSGSRSSDQLGRLTGSVLVIKAIVGLPWIIGMVIVLPLLNSQTFKPGMVLVSALSIWLESLFSTGLTVFKTLLRNQVTALLLIGARGGILLAAIILSAFKVQSVTAYAGIRLLVTMVAALAAGILLPIKPIVNSISFVRTVGMRSLPYAFSDLFSSIYLQADITIMGVLLSKESVGIYAPASSLVNALFVVPNACFSVAVPILARMYDAYEMERYIFNRALVVTVVMFLMVGIALWLSVWYASDTLPMFIFGSSFEGAGPLLRILSPILFLKSCCFAAAALLVAIGWQSRRTYVQAIAAITNFMLNILIIPRLGVTGAAMVYVVSEVVLLVGYVGLTIKWVLHTQSLSLIKQR